VGRHIRIPENAIADYVAAKTVEAMRLPGCGDGNKTSHRRFGSVRRRSSGRWQARYQGSDGLTRSAQRTLSGLSNPPSEGWDYSGINPVNRPIPMGQEHAGIVEAVGSDVTTISPGQFVIGPLFASDNTRPICQPGFHISCMHRELVVGAQAEYMRVPLTNSTLVATPGFARNDGPIQAAAVCPTCTGHSGRKYTAHGELRPLREVVCGFLVDVRGVVT
jgi:hypothetical protein